MNDGTDHLIRLQSIIGTGAYGTVFKALRLHKSRAHDEANWNREAQAVAVKQTVFTEVADDITVVLKEVSYLSNLQHPNIVSYYTAFTNHGSLGGSSSGGVVPSVSVGDPSGKAPLAFSESPSLCIVEELVDELSVAKALKLIAGCEDARPLQDVEIAAVLYDILQALLYIHEESRLVHRDIKPLNMLLDRRTTSVKLCDFGTCADMSQQTGRYTVIGTIGWIAPEVLESGVMDVRSGNLTSHSFPSDVWSLGVSALEMAKPSLNRTALSEYIKDLSASPCSLEQTTESTRKKFLYDKLHDGPLRDFIACCLRRDPKVRPTVRHLLEHPLIVKNGVSSAKERQTRIGLIIDAVNAARKTRALDSANEPHGVLSDGAFVATDLAYSSLSKTRCMEAIAAMKRDFFANKAILAEKTRTSQYNWCIPSNLAGLLSSVEFRYMPTYSRPQGLGQVPPPYRSGTLRGSSTAALKPLFDSVVLPATVDNQRVVLSIIRKYRKLGMTQTDEGRAAVDRRSNACYTISELGCLNLKHETLIQLHDDLLRTFKAVCVAIPDFASRFLSTFMECLTSTDEGVESLQNFVAYLHQLQNDDLIHTHRGKILASSTTGPKGLSNPSLPSPIGINETRALNFAMAEDWLRFPRMPQAAGFPLANEGNTGGGSVKAGGDPEMDDIRQQARLVNPSAFLFNKWLKEKQKAALGTP